MRTATIKPNRTVFITYSLALTLPLAIIFSAGLAWAGLAFRGNTDVPWFWIVLVVASGLFVLSALWAALTRGIQYRKRTYELSEKRIVVRSGGPFSDAATELELRNVTHVKLILPYLEHRFFGTGTVRIESAGAATTEAKLIACDAPEKLYETIIAMLRHNGFSLSSSEVLMQARASKTGATLDTLASIVVALFAGAYFILPAVLAALAIPILIVPILFLLVLIAIGLYANYRNALSKEYTITTDAIRYDEGFLTKRRAVIPAENLADSNVNEAFYKRIFGIADVTVSCQGTSQEIKFRNLADAPAFDRAVERIIDTERTVQPEASGEAAAGTKKRTARATRSAKRGATFEAMRFTPSIKPLLYGTAVAIAVLIVLTLPFAFIGGGIIGLIIFGASMIPIALMIGAVTVPQIIMLLRSTYTLDRNSVKSEIDFLNRNAQTFNDDRLTRVSITRSILDRLARTVTATFWSIGSGRQITFSHVPERSGLVEAITHKYGYRAPTGSRITSSPRIGSIVRSTFPGIVFAGFLVLLGGTLAAFGIWPGVISIGFIIAVLAIVGTVFVIAMQLTYRDAYLAIDEDTLYARYGWLTRVETYVDVEDIKGMTTTRYPLGSTGALSFNVAGESIRKTKDGEVVVPNRVTMPFVPDALGLGEELSRSIDELAAPGSTRITVKPHVPTIIVPIMIFGIVLFPLLPIMAIIASISGAVARRTTFSIEDHRVLKHVNYLYESNTVLFHDRIDFLSIKQGPIQKLFKSGSVLVNTTGSSRVEMTIGPIAEHRAVSEALTRAYRAERR